MPNVGGNVFADLPITTGERLDELAVFVAQRARQAVDLGLGGKVDRSVVGQRQEAPDAPYEISDVCVVERVVEASHRARVRHLRKMRGGCGADLRAWRIAPDQVRKGSFQRSVATDQCIVIGIRKLGRIVRMIQRVVTGDLVREVREFCGSVGVGMGKRGGGRKRWHDASASGGPCRTSRDSQA